MKCQRCGAELLDTDTFCVKCGQKVGEPARCPVCGEILSQRCNEQEGYTDLGRNCSRSLHDWNGCRKYRKLL